MGGEGPTIAIIQGLKVRVPVLDSFLNANGVDETYGLAPFYDVDPDEQSLLLRSKVGHGDTRTRIFVPSKMDHNESNFAYVAWAWDMVYAQEEILLDHQLPTDPPAGWEAVKNEILAFSQDTDSTWEAAGHGKTGLFIIVSDERRYLGTSPCRFSSEILHLSIATNARPLLISFINARSTGDRSTESTRDAIRSQIMINVDHNSIFFLA